MRGEHVVSVNENRGNVRDLALRLVSDCHVEIRTIFCSKSKVGAGASSAPGIQRKTVARHGNLFSLNNGPTITPPNHNIQACLRSQRRQTGKHLLALLRLEVEGRPALAL